jgi:hypothetical protein
MSVHLGHDHGGLDPSNCHQGDGLGVVAGEKGDPPGCADRSAATWRCKRRGTPKRHALKVLHFKLHRPRGQPFRKRDVITGVMGYSTQACRRILYHFKQLFYGLIHYHSLHNKNLAMMVAQGA